MDKAEALNIIIEIAQQKHDEAEVSIKVSPETSLIGGRSGLDSMALVELCLALEDRAEELNFEFDWTSDAALSKSKSMYRSVEALSNEFFSQYKRQN